MTHDMRIDRLEQALLRVRMHFRILVAFMGVGGAIAVGLGAARLQGVDAGEPQPVRASAFILQDHDGKTHASLELGRHGPRLSLFDPDGKTRLAVDLDGGEPRLMLLDQASKPIVALGTSLGLGGELALCDQNGVMRARLSASLDMPALSLRDDKAQVRVLLSGGVEGEASRKALQGTAPPGPGLAFCNGKGGVEASFASEGISLSDQNGKAAASFTLRDSKASLWMQDGAGQARIWLHVEENGASLKLMDKDSKGRLTLGAGTTESPDGRVTIYPESSLRLFDPSGTVVWSTPK